MLRRIAGDDESARADFECAAKLGSPFAKKEAVALNPMAQLCNQVMSKVLADAVAGIDDNAAAEDIDVDVQAELAASKRARQTNQMDNVADACDIDE